MINKLLPYLLFVIISIVINTLLYSHITIVQIIVAGMILGIGLCTTSWYLATRLANALIVAWYTMQKRRLQRSLFGNHEQDEPDIRCGGPWGQYVGDMNKTPR